MVAFGISMFGFPIMTNKYEIIRNNEIIETIEQEQNEYLSYEYSGYLEIPKYNIKRLIKVGPTEEIINSNYILYYNSFKSLDDNNQNIILFGHNVESVFRFLHYLEIGDEIMLVTHKKCYMFEVYNIDVISETDTYILEKNYDYKNLTLITCMKNNKKRLVLSAKLKKI